MKKHLFLVIAFATVLSAKAQDAATFRKWGDEILEVINYNLRQNSFNYLYDEQIGSGAAFAWPMGIQLKALIYAGEISYAESLYAEFQAHYYYYGNGYSAFNAVCNSRNDRYYDDNAWIAKDLMDLYDKTGKTVYLDRAKTVLKFCMSGELPTGGIHFHEGDGDPTSPNYMNWSTCATSPTTCVNLKLYIATKDDKYLVDGKRLYDFMKAKVWGIGPGYRGYENAVIMEAATLLYKITGEAVYLADAQRIGYAMESRYISVDSHRLNEVGCWGGHDMTDAYVNLYEVDHDQNWLDIVAGYLSYLHENCRDAKGFYPESWDDTAKDGKRFQLLDQASACSAFYKMSLTPGGQPKQPDACSLYQDPDWNNYGATGSAWSMGLKVGTYTKEQLAFLGLLDTRFNFKADISSLKVQDGYKVTAYMYNNFVGTPRVYTSNVSNLSAWNDRIISLKVESLTSGLTEEQSSQKSVMAYQSDDNGALMIDNLPNESTLEILNLTGRQVYSGVASEGIFSLNTSFLAKGFYLLRVKSEKNEQVIKIQIK